MNRPIRIFATAALTALTAVACIRPEAPNAEADILTCTVPDSIMAGDVVVDNYSVRIRAKANADISKLAPVFTITEGATITPASGSVQNFAAAKDNIIYYTVVSQDGEWKKVYPVRVVNKEIPTEYKFNGTTTDPTGAYDVFSELDINGSQVMEWATGNPGYNLCGVARNRTEYPSVLMKDDAIGNYVKLETRSTGWFGQMVKMPIAAGNLFQGVFELANATSKPLEATKFGETFFYQPMAVTGKYKYKAGAVFTDRAGNVVNDRRDMFSIYALFYETDDKTPYIDGNIHVTNFKHPNLISLAMLDNPHESDEWVDFVIPFVTVDGKEIDPQKLIAGKYKVGIVISSSADGDSFQGAVGSTLYIADLRLEYRQFQLVSSH